MISRADYMQGKATHRAYYGQFVTDGLRAFIAARVGIERLRASTDEHFNDIPLALWDSFAGVVASYAGRAIREAQGYGHSLSDCVCTAKEAARQVTEEAAQ
jgi:hypothetical protein